MSGPIRRNVRLRKEYLYRKSLEGVEAEKYEKKRAIREALKEGKALPTELRGEQEVRLGHMGDPLELHLPSHEHTHHRRRRRTH